MKHTQLSFARLIASAIVATIALTGCGQSSSSPTAPSTALTVAAAQRAGPSFSQSANRSGTLSVTKDCSAYTGLAGSYCTITSSNVKGIEVGSKVIYAKAVSAGILDTDVILEPPGPGNNRAFGHVFLDLVNASGTVTFSGGTGKFTHFQGQGDVSHLTGRNWAWSGTFSFGDADVDD